MTKEEQKKEEVEEQPQEEAQEKTQEQEIEELTTTVKRVQAEFVAYRQRVERDRQTHIDDAYKKVIEKLLPVLDNFEIAFKNKDHENKEEFVNAMQMVHDQFQKTLNEIGVKKLDCIGKPFDPHCHQPLVQEESDKEPNTIIEEIQSGYELKDRLLRPAMVKVAKAKQTDDSNSSEGNKTEE